ncbi:hypothetical protein PspLS_11943 [Pyricularia sp. CBS 133598]|nr:hypothetical protein PspLS_11943 [Pyricularia sp. CBS 133598]
MSKQDTRGIIDLALAGDAPHQIHSIFNIFLPHCRAEVARLEAKEISARLPKPTHDYQWIATQNLQRGPLPSTPPTSPEPRDERERPTDAALRLHYPRDPSTEALWRLVKEANQSPEGLLHWINHKARQFTSVRAIAANRLPSGDIEIRFRCEQDLATFRSEARAGLRTIHPLLTIAARWYEILVHSIPTAEVKMSPEGQRKLAQDMAVANDYLQTTDIATITWLAPGATKKRNSTLVIGFYTPIKANRALRQGVVLYGQHHATERYFPDLGILQCSNCTRFGHNGIRCRAAAQCTTCAGEHATSTCTAPLSLHRCARCNGPHKAISANCPKRLELIESNRQKRLALGPFFPSSTNSTNHAEQQEGDEERYREIRREYNQAIRNWHRDSYRDFALKAVNNSRVLWKLAKVRKNRADPRIPHIARITKPDGTTSSDTSDIADALREKFFPPTKAADLSDLEDYQYPEPFTDYPITEHEILLCSRNLSNGKAPGPDGTANELFKLSLHDDQHIGRAQNRRSKPPLHKQ